MNAHLLIVEDQPSMGDLIQKDLQLRGMSADVALNASEALHQLERQAYDVVLTDLRMPGADGLELCRQIGNRWPDIPVIVMTAFGSLESAVAAMRAGAHDFVTKPIELDLLALTIERAVKHRRLSDQVRRLEQQLGDRADFGDLIGESPIMQKMFRRIEKIGPTESSILMTGESGTGKELVANVIHRQSARADGPFVAVNCAALPENLLESELFGHAKGAFTDAKSERTGLFLQADGGTLLLDEIGEMPISMQVKLLRALEQSRVRPVGSNTEREFDVRILSATNRDLEAAIDEQQFREDLYYRINVIQLELPPLRSRGGDILLLAQSFLHRFASRAEKPVTGISESAAQHLLDYNWPGNVRELRNVIERAVALTNYDKLQPDDLPDKIQNHEGSQVVLGGSNPDELLPLADVERQYILHVMESVSGNRTLAARVLGLDRKTLYRKLKSYGVQ